MQPQSLDVLGSTSLTLTFDYYSDPGSQIVTIPNQLYVEALNYTTGNWIVVQSFLTHTNGWEVQTIDLSGFDSSGLLTIRFRGESGGDSYDFYNDILLDNIAITDTLFSLSCFSAPFMEDFDTWTNGQSLPSSCWSQSIADDFDWTINAAGTPSANTGPSDDMTGGGKYMYIETSSPRVNGDEAVLYLDSLNLNSLLNPQLRFYFHMFGAGVGTLNIDISSDGGTFSNIFTKSGNQGNAWIEELVNISAYNGIVTFRITGVRGNTWSRYCDNFQVKKNLVSQLMQPIILQHVTVILGSMGIPILHLTTVQQIHL